MSRNRAVLGAGMLGGLLLPGPAATPSDVEVSGSIALAGIADDNLFATPGSGESDTISRLTPNFAAGFRSPRAALTTRYAFDMERYTDHPELDTDRARQAAALDLSARLSRVTTVSLAGEYVTTLTPGDLNVTTGLSAGRLPARRRTLSPAIEWRVGSAGSARAAWALTEDEVAGGVTTTTGVSTLAFRHHFSTRDTGSLSYAHSRYDFESGDLTTAHALSLGWERSLGPGAGLMMRGGPRFSEGRVDPEVSLSVEHGARVLRWSLNCARSFATVIGREGPVMTDSLQPGLVLVPRRSVRVRVAPGIFEVRDARGGPRVRVLAGDLEASWRLGEWLSFVTTYRRSRQEGSLDPAPLPGGPPTGIIARDTFLVSLVTHVGGERAPGAGAPSPE